MKLSIPLRNTIKFPCGSDQTAQQNIAFDHSMSPYQVCSEKCMDSVQVIIKQLTHADDHFTRDGSEEVTHLQIFPTLPKYCNSRVGKNGSLHKLSATHLLGTWFWMPETRNLLSCVVFLWNDSALWNFHCMFLLTCYWQYHQHSHPQNHSSAHQEYLRHSRHWSNQTAHPGSSNNVEFSNHAVKSSINSVTDPWRKICKQQLWINN